MFAATALKAPKSITVRRAIILLSDGDDNQSHVTREEAIEMAQRAEAIVYTISTNVSGTRPATSARSHRRRHRWTPVPPFQIRDVANAFAEIQDELRSQYAISYKPATSKPTGTIAPSKSRPTTARISGCARAAAGTRQRNSWLSSSGHRGTIKLHARIFWYTTSEEAGDQTRTPCRCWMHLPKLRES